MKAHLLYLRYVIRHKRFVLLAGLKTGAPLWRLLVHDWSKFLPCEWFPYVAHFYQPKPVAYYGEARMHGYPGPHEVERIMAARSARFDRAWLHHQHANPHHHQHRVLRQDDGSCKALPMPESFVREMVADWAGAGRAITGRWDLATWYAKNRDNMILHPEARALVERLLAEVRFA